MNTRSLTFRLVAWYAGWLTLLFIVFGIVVYTSLSYYLKRDLEEALGHGLEPLSAQQGVQEVREQGHAHDQPEEIRALHTRSRNSTKPISDANTATSRRMARRSMTTACDRRRQGRIRIAPLGIKISSGFRQETRR